MTRTQSIHHGITFKHDHCMISRPPGSTPGSDLQDLLDHLSKTSWIYSTTEGTVGNKRIITCSSKKTIRFYVNKLCSYLFSFLNTYKEMDIPRFRTYVEEVPGHKCDLNTRLVVDLMVYGTEHPTTTERFLGALRRVSVVSRRHPFTKNMFRSTAAIAAEVTRHMETAPYIIHPYSYLRSNYEIFLFFLYLVFCAYTPLFVWTLTCNDLFADILFVVILALFWVDIFINFCTGYVNKKQFVVVLDQKRIALNYVSTYFFIDIISSIPYSFIFTCKTELLNNKTYYWVDIICALKLVRIGTMYSLFKHLSFRIGVNMVVRQIARVVLALLFYLHWVACFCSAVTAMSKEIFTTRVINTTESAIWILHFNAQNTEYTWRNAMLRAITLTFACGFRIIFTEFGDMLVNIIFFLLGIVVVVLVAVRVVVIGRTVESHGSQFTSLRSQLVEYMRHKQVPPYLERRLIEYYSFSFERTYYHEPAIISFLSGQLQKDLLLQKGRQMMEATDVFDDVPPAVMARLVAGLRTTVVLPGDVVLRMGKPADRMVYVSSGTLAVYDVAGAELCHLRDGQVMGEESLVATSEVLGVTVIALETSELWLLSRAYFLAASRAGASSIVGGASPSVMPRKTIMKLKQRLEQSIPPLGRDPAGMRDPRDLR